MEKRFRSGMILSMNTYNYFMLLFTIHFIISFRATTTRQTFGFFYILFRRSKTWKLQVMDCNQVLRFVLGSHTVNGLCWMCSQVWHFLNKKKYYGLSKNATTSLKRLKIRKIYWGSIYRSVPVRKVDWCCLWKWKQWHWISLNDIFAENVTHE